MMEKIYPELKQYIDKEEFPHHIIQKFKELGISGLEIEGFGSPGLNIVDSGALFYELARWDSSIATFFIVHNSLGQSVIDKCGDDEQRKRILTDTVPLNKIMCFGLTEPNNGSDATGLQTTAKKVEGGYILNGQKRWIGNGTFADYITVWARNSAENNKI